MTIFRLIRVFPVLLYFHIYSRLRQRIEPDTASARRADGAVANSVRFGSVTLTAPVPVSPVNGDQLATLRPTLTVQNGTSSSQSGTRTYEFQVSDRTDFSLGASLATSFLVAVNQTGVPEGDGRTSFTVPSGSPADDADVLARAGRSRDHEL